MTRVAVVHSFYSEGSPSGENNVVRDQADQLQRAGYEVKLIARHTDDYVVERGYKWRSALTATTGRGASPEAELERFQPHVVHLHNTFPNWGTRWLSAWGRRTVLTLHNFRPVCANGLLFRDGHPCRDCLTVPAVPAVVHACYRSSRVQSVPLGIAASPIGALRRVVRSCSAVISLNDDSANLYGGVFGRPIEVVPNFVRELQASSAAVTNRWAYVGRLTTEKGIDNLLISWPESEQLDVIGDGELAESIQHAVGNMPNVNMLGKLPREELARRLPSYQGLVVPSLCPEQLPTVVLEALAAGAPCLLSRHIPVAAGMEEAGAAVTFDPASGRGSLLRGIQQVLGGRPQMSDAARRLYLAHYTPEVWQERMERIYSAVVDGGRSAGEAGPHLPPKRVEGGS